MRSQNASTASTRFSPASVGIVSLMTTVEIGLAPFENSGGSACAASNVARTETGRRSAEAARDAQRLALGRGFEAVAGLDLDRRHAFGDQRVEAPQSLSATSSSSLAARVARTVERMPPPARAISS